MKKISILLFILIMTACKPTPKKEANEQVMEQTATMEAPTNPEALGKVLDSPLWSMPCQNQILLRYIPSIYILEKIE
nr:hypothetical protein [uncultured Allomuricauda sp.]